MATTKVSALTAIPDANVSATDVVPVVDDIVGTPTTYRMSLAQLRTALLTAQGSGWGASDYASLGSGTIPSSGMIRVGQGSIASASAPLINSTVTWNDAAVTFTHFLVNVTDTASAAGSLLADWQVGGSSKWKVTKAGAVTQAGALTVSAGGITVTGGISSAGSIGVASGGISVTGNSTIAGTLAGLTGLTVSSGTTAVQALTATGIAVTASTAGSYLLDVRNASSAATAFGMQVLSNTTDAAAPVLGVGSSTVNHFRVFGDSHAVFGGQVQIAAGGLTVSSGTTTVQAFTATTGGFSSDVTCATTVSFTAGGVSGFIGQTATPGQIINSSQAGDLLIRAGSKRIVFSPDAGATSAIVIAATSAVSIASTLAVGGAVTISAGGLSVTGGITGALTGNVTGNVSGSSGSCTGNAATATALQTARTINGTSFDGTANITVTAAAGTLTGATLAAGVTASSLTSVGVLASPHMTSPVVDSGGLTVSAGNVSISAGTISASAQGLFGNYNGSGSIGLLSVSADTNTAASAGAASLPAAPVGFLAWHLGSTSIRIPYYNA